MAALSASPKARLARALLSLDGLSIGDGFGERYFVHPAVVRQLIEERALPAEPWRYTDDTQMALSIVAVLRQHGAVDQDALARDFAARYDRARGYGPAMHDLLARIRTGEPWRSAAASMFAGQGSYGNGAAMRVAPLGAYFADDLHQTAEQAALSAGVTHAHPEGIVGAMAVAVAAALAACFDGESEPPSPAEFLDLIAESIPDGAVRSGLRRARDLTTAATVQVAVATLGNGSQVSAQDTVPFALWCAANQLADYEEAQWLTVSGLGDRDTTCAIVGGIVALSAAPGSVPGEWRRRREPLPVWARIEGAEVG